MWIFPKFIKHRKNLQNESKNEKLTVKSHITSLFRYLQSTMLQKFSKCEVKAWLSWNLIIIPPLRFHVKWHFGKFKQSKNVIYDNFRNAELQILVNLGLESCFRFTKNQNSKPLKLPQMAFLDVWICRKFWVMVRLSNFIKIKS